MQWRVVACARIADAQISHGFARNEARLFLCNVRTHEAQGVQHPCACGIYANVLDQQVSTGNDRPRNEPEGRRANVTWNNNGLAMQPAGAMNGNTVPFWVYSQVGSKCLQHSFAVVA